MGYHRAGFEVVGVDIQPQPNYPFEFRQGDAMAFPLGGFDAIHASPPCQAYTRLRHAERRRERPELVEPIRARLEGSGVPYVIENVVGAPLTDPVMLCGTMFGLGIPNRQLWRHRLFELGGWWTITPFCEHIGRPIGVWGNRSYTTQGRTYTGTADERRAAMQMPWATWRECGQAVPPAYTEWLGLQLLSRMG